MGRRRIETKYGDRLRGERERERERKRYRRRAVKFALPHGRYLHGVGHRNVTRRNKGMRSCGGESL